MLTFEDGKACRLYVASRHIALQDDMLIASIQPQAKVPRLGHILFVRPIDAHQFPALPDDRHLASVRHPFAILGGQRFK